MKGLHMPSEDAALARSLLTDGFSRTADALPQLLSGLSSEELLWRPAPGANSIAWLTWHLTRVQDDHVSGVADSAQVWLAQGWSDRFDLPYPPGDIGFGQDETAVSAFTVSDPQLLLGYHSATQEMTSSVVDSLRLSDFERVVDDRWDPPVTAAVRLVSVVDDLAQHTGQISYLRGLLTEAGV